MENVMFLPQWNFMGFLNRDCGYSAGSISLHYVQGWRHPQIRSS